MSDNDLPGTLKTEHAPARANASPQNTTVPEPGTSPETVTQLDLRGYELMERLGGGGMGDVYRAGDPALGRDLAVKVMKAELRDHPSAERRFLREARVTGSLQHPGIVPIYNLGRLADGRLHYTMRLVRGGTLADILREEAGKPERLPALLTIFEKVCQAVAYAHSKQVIHRDLKPANVMVGRFGEVQVMDWGLAKLLTVEDEPAAADATVEKEGTRIHTEAADTPPEQTRMGREMGTPAYMPPEQALGEWDAVDERADVFALGAILCEILTAHPPYSGQDSADALRKAKRGDCAEALARLEGCGADAALVGLCRECLALAREDRPRDAEQVAQRVAAYQTEMQERLRRAELECVAAEARAQEEKARTKAEQRARRRLRALLAMSLAVLALAIGGGWLVLREREARTKATLARMEDLARAQEAGNHYMRAEILYSKGQLKESIPEYQKSAELLPHNVEYWFMLAAVLYELKRWDEAISAYETVIRLKPDYTLAYSELGDAWYNKGEMDKAIAAYQEAIRLEPDYAPYHSNLGNWLRAKGRLDQALAEYREVLRLDSTYAPAHNGVGNVMFDQNQWDEASAAFRKAIQFNPQEPIYQNNYGLALLRLGQFSEAIPVFAQAFKQRESTLGADHPDTLVTTANLAIAYREVGQLNDAVALLEKALQQARKHAGGVPTVLAFVPGALAETYDRARQFEKAESLYREALEQSRRQFGPNDLRTADVLVLLSFNLLKQKKSTEAESLLRDCLRIREAKQPDDWTTFSIRSMLGEALAGQKKYTEAEPLLLQGYEGMKQRQNKIPPAYRLRNLSEALERLVRLYEATDRNDKAADWRKTLQETKAAAKKPKS